MALAEELASPGFVFSTESGLSYAYDDDTGVVLPLEALGSGGFAGGRGAFAAQDPFARYRSGSPPRVPLAEWSPERVKQAITLAPSLQLTLIVTERCTLRCRYCVYTGTYDYARTHSSTDMSVETAFRAVDYLARQNEHRSRSNPGRTPALGFYGGEPLLRFDLLKAVVEHTERIGFRCSYSITTNGTVDDLDVVSFLVKKGFAIAVSLDGPPEEHDRNRVFPSGQGSFERAYGFLQKVRRESERANGKAPYLVLTCADRATDLRRVCEFFDGDPAMFQGIGARAALVYPYRTSYYDGWPPEELMRAESTAVAIWPPYRDALATSTPAKQLGFRDWLFGIGLRSLIRGLALAPNPLRGACVPGSRLAADCRGQLHVCERVNQNYPVGDVETGLRLDRVCEILRAFERHLGERCRGCNVKRLCSACFSMAFTDGGASMDIPPEYCADTRKTVRGNLGALFSILELNPDVMQILDPSPFDLEQDRIFNG